MKAESRYRLCQSALGVTAPDVRVKYLLQQQSWIRAEEQFQCIISAVLLLTQQPTVTFGSQI